MPALHKPYLGIAVLATVVMALLSIAHSYNYLLFHTIAEVFSIIVAAGIFMIAWNSREFLDNDYLLFIGIAFLWVASVDLLHAQAYSGMNIFKEDGGNLATQLWIIARYLQAAALAIAPLYLTKRLNAQLAFIAFSVVTTALVAAALTGIFPACFVEGMGLTAFKRASEYIICAILFFAIYSLYRRSAQFDGKVYRLLVASVLITILSEMAFTLYTGVYGYFNALGHFLKIVAFYLIYKAIIEEGLRRPYALLFRNLKLSEEQLRRTLSEVKTLRGIVPICASCKKIRDDQGYWQQVEVYVSSHTNADFSHSICPECMKKLYPEYYRPEWGGSTPQS